MVVTTVDNISFNVPLLIVPDAAGKLVPKRVVFHHQLTFICDKYSSTVIEAFLVSLVRFPFIVTSFFPDIKPEVLETSEPTLFLPWILKFPPDWIVALSVTTKFDSNTGSSISIISYLLYPTQLTLTLPDNFRTLTWV